MAIRVLEETGLLPHLNPGVMSWEELQPAQAGRAVDGDDARDHRRGGCSRPRARPTSAPRTRTRRSGCGCSRTPAGCRSRSPPALLVGIGETLDRARRVDLRAARASPARTAHVQEVIVQNFRAKPDTAMRHADDLGLEEYRRRDRRHPAACSARRRGCRRRRTSSTSTECRPLLGAGVDDWGGVSPLTPDHVNPERPWPSARATARRSPPTAGFELRDAADRAPRVRPAPASPGSTRGSRPTSPRWPTPDGLGREPGVRPVGLPWQEPDGGLRRPSAAPTCTPRSTPTGRTDRPPRRLRRRLRRLGRRCGRAPRVARRRALEPRARPSATAEVLRRAAGTPSGTRPASPTSTR